MIDSYGIVTIGDHLLSIPGLIFVLVSYASLALAGKAIAFSIKGKFDIGASALIGGVFIAIFTYVLVSMDGWIYVAA